MERVRFASDAQHLTYIMRSTIDTLQLISAVAAAATRRLDTGAARRVNVVRLTRISDRTGEGESRHGDDEESGQSGEAAHVCGLEQS